MYRKLRALLQPYGELVAPELVDSEAKGAPRPRPRVAGTRGARGCGARRYGMAAPNCSAAARIISSPPASFHSST